MVGLKTEISPTVVVSVLPLKPSGRFSAASGGLVGVESSA